ncbi:MAG: NUDIX hydrolase, partial [Rhodospirillales bacterium]
MYRYDYPHPAVTTDIVIFTIRDKKLKLLLIRRAAAPFKGSWALPGGFVDIDEDLESGARRELQEETGV